MKNKESNFTDGEKVMIVVVVILLITIQLMGYQAQREEQKNICHRETYLMGLQNGSVMKFYYWDCSNNHESLGLRNYDDIKERLGLDYCFRGCEK